MFILLNSRLQNALLSLFLVVSVSMLTACSTTMDAMYLAQSTEKTIIYLVRHAEKADGSRDPDLNEAGRARSLELADVLSGVEVNSLWSSDYIRTRETLAPLASRRNLAVALYDAGDSEGLVSTVMSESRGSVVVIAGHSNTVPALVDLFEAWPNPVTPATARPNLGHEEYDSLFVVTLVEGQEAVVEKRKY
ncbi:MAG: histidine phosphatase family protein [Gammaproteobacteria bacterium]